MSAVRVIVYSRPQCHLCDQALEVLTPLLRRFAAQLEVRNVEDDPAWEARYGTQIPVGFLGDRKLFKAHVQPARVERLLRAATRA